jgi:hypothetical protein
METLTFGCFDNFKYVMNWFYDDICSKIEKLAVEIGPDRYGRTFNAQPLLEFAIDKNITDRSINYIYRHFVYDKLIQNGINCDELEISDMMKEFEIVI